MSWYEIKNVTDTEADLWIYEQVGEDWWTGEGVTAKQFAKDLAALKVANINLHINSPGGNVWDGQAIYTSLVNHPAKVTSYIDGLAASIASVIAMAGDRIVMADNALMMIHNPAGSAMGCTAAEMRQLADTLDKVRDTIIGVYAKRSSLSEDELGVAMDAETWYSAAEAVELGFADETSSAIELAACAPFDAKALGFKHVPEQLRVTPAADSSEDIETDGGAPEDSSDTGGAPEPRKFRFVAGRRLPRLPKEED